MSRTISYRIRFHTILFKFLLGEGLSSICFFSARRVERRNLKKDCLAEEWTAENAPTQTSLLDPEVLSLDLPLRQG